jgi:hypothetical protein
MSTASRYCGMAGGTCGGGITQAPVPGATGGTRGHYDPRASGKATRSSGTVRKRLPLATNAAPPRKRAGAGLPWGACPALPATPAQRAHRAIFPIGLRERPFRHSLPPPRMSARGVRPRGRPPP